MDQIKIGKFIAACRKEQGLSQARLAEKLEISDRAVSKWENGKSMPDSSIMLELCQILKINVNELLSGERIMSEVYNKQAEENLLAMRKEVEEKNRQMLGTEILISIPIVGISLMMMMVSINVEMPEGTRTLLVGMALAMILTIGFVSISIEQKAGFYQCAKCHHKHTPTYWLVILAPHFGFSRYMKCPKCGKYGWHKKVITFDDDQKEVNK